MTERPEAETMGWWPAGERSMMARRRGPSAMPAAGSTQAPASSGPRWPTAAAIAEARAVRPSASRPRGSRKPAMPHIGPIVRYAAAVRVLVTGAFGYVGLAVVRRLAGEHAVIALGRTPRACPPG